MSGNEERKLPFCFGKEQRDSCRPCNFYDECFEANQKNRQVVKKSWIPLKDEPKEYREYGVAWSSGETPLKFTRPIGYIYICQRCGRRFESDKEIHIPWCDICREEEFL
jgi:hypothetical protein